jgi:hypothetical protein
MKLVLIIAIVTSFTNLYAQNYQAPKFLEGAGNPSTIGHADIDGDGDRDVIFSTNENSKVYAILNNGGNLKGPQIPVTSGTTDLHLDGSYNLPFTVGDFDKDGKDEIAVYDNLSASSTLRLSIFKFDGQKFIIITTLSTPNLSANTIVSSDFNKDGLLDIFFTADNAYEYEAKPLGGYQLKTIVTEGVAAKGYVADLNSDSWPDLITHDSNFKISIYLNQVNGTFKYNLSQVARFSTIQKIEIADFNMDGRNDFVVKSWTENFLELFSQNSDGTFSSNKIQLNSYPGSGMTVFDQNNDGRPDILVNSQRNNPITHFGITTLLNMSGGFFDMFYSEDIFFGSDIEAIDLDNDSKKEVIVLNEGRNILVYDNLTPTLIHKDNIPFGYFPTNPSSCTTTDLNKDGKEDIIIANRNSSSISMLFQKSNGEFASPVFYMIPNNPTKVTTADLNEDEFPDLLVTSNQVTGPSGTYQLLSKPDGTYTAAILISTGSELLVSDFNHDGKTDVYNGNVTTFGDGAGNFFSYFPDYSIPTIISTASGDLNGDSYGDIVLASTSGLSFYYGKNAKSIDQGPNILLSKTPNKVVCADINHDSKTDLAVLNMDGSMSLLINTGNGAFVEKSLTTELSSNMVLADINNDSFVDLALRSVSLKLFIYLGTADGSFLYASEIPLPYGLNEFTLHDLNGDNQLDFVLIGSPLALLLSHGSSIPEPTTAPNLTPTFVGDNFFRFNIAKGNGTGRLIVARKKNYSASLPLDGKKYNVSPLLGNGSEIGKNNYAVLQGDATTGEIKNLSEGTEYVITAFEFSESAGAINYLTSSFPVLEFKTMKSQVISALPVASKLPGDVDFLISATTNSGLPLKFQKISGDIVLDGSKVHIVGPGPVTIKITQEGDNIYLAAAEVLLSFCINPLKPFITTNISSSKYILTSSSDTNNQWMFQGQTIPDATSKQFEPISDGIYSVKVDYAGCSATSEPTSHLIAGIEDNYISIFPNPFSKTLSITLLDTKTIKEITVFDSKGQQMNLTHQILNDKVITIDFEGTSSGLYYLKLITNTGSTSSKLFKQ